MTLSENIKSRRKQLRLSQEYVADQLGISRQAVAKWENGKSNPTAANLAELAALFETSISELTDSQTYTEEQTMEKQQAQQEKRKITCANVSLFLGRIFSVAMMNVSWDSYSSGSYGRSYSYVCVLFLAASLVLLFITSYDMGKKHKMEKTEIFLGAAMIFSIFFLPRLLPVQDQEMKNFLADMVTYILVIILAAKYWRYIWKLK